MDRVQVLDEAKRCVTGRRQDDYGIPEDNFRIIADFWTAYKGAEFSPHDVAMMMALLKIARIRNGGGSGDSYADLCGYSACAGELAPSGGRGMKPAGTEWDGRAPDSGDGMKHFIHMEE